MQEPVEQVDEMDEGSPFHPQNFEPQTAKKTIPEEEEEAEPEERPEPEIRLKKPAPKPPEKKERPAIPRILPPPPPPHSEVEEAETEKEDEHAKHKQKKENLVEASQPELLRALVELVSKNATVQVVESLKDSELSLAELVEKTGVDENEIKDIVHRLTCLGLIKELWYKSAAGSHLRKYNLENTKGTIEFDLLALKDTLPIEELKAKSTRLVALITTGGRMPKSVLLKALPVMDDGQLEQVIRYTEKFKLPSIRDMLTVESKVSLELKSSKQEEASGDEKPPEVTDLYYEIENIQKSLGELE